MNDYFVLRRKCAGLLNRYYLVALEISDVFYVFNLFTSPFHNI